MQAKVYLNRYRLYLDQVGLPIVIRRSASEATFKAQDLEDHKDVCLQVVPVTALRTVVREQLEAEAKAAQQITHINIPALYDFGFEDGQIVYVTEFFTGNTAFDWVKTCGTLPVNPVLRIAQQVVNASSVLTFHGIIHHAINPSNIMLVPGQTTEGEWPLIKLLNCVGVAPSLTPPENPDANTADPVNFASPEQMQTGAVDFRSQMYSLGSTLWFLLTGAPPLEGAAGVERASGVPSAVRHLIAHMIADDPTARPLDPVALQAHIQACLDQFGQRESVLGVVGKTPVAPVPTAVARTAERRRIPRKALALAAVLIALATITAVVLANRSRPRQAIGVPIGVPETPQRALSEPTSAPSQQAGAPIAQPSAPPSSIAAASPPAPPAATAIAAASPAVEPPVLTSVQPPAPQDEAERADSETAREGTQVAAADSSDVSATPESMAAPGSPAATRAAPQIAANNSSSVAQESEPLPPSEGPSETTAPSVASSPAQVAQNQPVRQSSEPEATASSTRDSSSNSTRRTVAENRPREKAARVAKSSKRTAKKARIATAESGGTVRAQYLGTTPEGELIFGLPSAERVYAQPPSTAAPREPRRRSRSEPREYIDQLPVLPALPPDE